MPFGVWKLLFGQISLRAQKSDSGHRVLPWASAPSPCRGYQNSLCLAQRVSALLAPLRGWRAVISGGTIIPVELSLAALSCVT